MTMHIKPDRNSIKQGKLYDTGVFKPLAPGAITDQ